jgi:hypothetical protein
MGLESSTRPVGMDVTSFAFTDTQLTRITRRNLLRQFGRVRTSHGE